MKLKIVDIKHPVLRRKAKVVTKIDKKIIKLIEDMKETLLVQHDPEGVGLAAPQVGKSLRIFLMHYPDEKISLKVVINPRVLMMSKTKVKPKADKKNILEGCLSLPHYYGPVVRAKKIKIEYVDMKGKKNIEEFGGFASQIVQHELDHLDGKIFIDHILKAKGPLYFIREDEYEEVEI